MSFYSINSFQYSNLNKNIINFNSLCLNKITFKDNTQYKLKVIKYKEIESINEYTLTLNKNFVESSTSKHPKEALTIPLQQGTYKIILKSVGIYNKETDKFNDCIKSSKGNVLITEYEFIDNENKFDENNNINYSNVKYKSINEFEFKMSRAGQFSIWIEFINKDDLIGNFECYLIKISNSEIDETSESYLFTKNTYDSLMVNLIQNYLFLFEIYELKDDSSLFNPRYKYPEGNYQVVLNTNLITTSNDELLENIILNDSRKFNLRFGKINSLNNIQIPYNVNPLNYYYMIGKIEFLLYFDFISDSYYFQPTSYGECFMALYVPRSTCSLVEESENNTYVIYKVTSYTLIHNDFRNVSKIKENIKKWLDVKDNDIHIDEYELYYWINLQNCDLSIFYKTVNYLTQIESFYSYIDLSINGYVYDDVSVPINEDDDLNYTLSNIRFNKVSYSSNVNFIKWEQLNDWRNYNNTQNLLYTEIIGTGTIKITKQHFKIITNIDIDSQSLGTLTTEQLLKLNINKPKLQLYNRFQYWLRTSKF